MLENHAHDCRVNIDKSGTCQTLTGKMGTGGGNVPLLMDSDAYCLQGNMIGRDEKNGPQGNGINKNVSFTLNATDIHCVTEPKADEKPEDTVKEVFGVDCRNGVENNDLCATLQAKASGGYSHNCIHPVRIGYTVRRLTPMECERLQGFEDNWTLFGVDGKPISDTQRYKALGNSVAIPCVSYIMQNIAELLAK
jgi:DNA (cytosine-5)-methyltransferase 1